MDCATLRELITGELSRELAITALTFVVTMAFAGRAGATWQAMTETTASPDRGRDEVSRANKARELATTLRRTGLAAAAGMAVLGVQAVSISLIATSCGGS